ncbi:MAG: helix-turn-helix domain-containing protein [Treponema sp.]
MTIYFYTLQKKICKKIADILEENHNVCCIYTDENDFYTAVTNMKKYPDLLLLDYLVFDHDTFNVYRYMNEINCKIPLLFYNEPPSIYLTRVQHWNMILNLYYTDSCINIADYEPTLKLLSSLVNSKELGPYISLLQIPKPYPEDEKKDSFSPYINPFLFNEKFPLIQKHISSSLYSVFCILYINRKKSVSIEEIQSLLHERNIEVTINTIYSDISRIRSLFRTSDMTNMDIHKTKRGYCLFIDDE